MQIINGVFFQKAIGLRLNHRLTIFYDPFQYAKAKRGELASLRTVPLFTLLASYGYPRKTSKYLCFSRMHYPRNHAKVEENNNKSPSVDSDFS